MVEHDFVKSLRQKITEGENLLWRHLRGHRLGGENFRRQQVIGPYVVDFVHFAARIVVEADGGQDNESAVDERRDTWLNSRGFRVMRLWNNESLHNTDAFLDVVMAAVQQAPSPPAPPPRGGRGASAGKF